MIILSISERNKISSIVRVGVTLMAINLDNLPRNKVLAQRVEAFKIERVEGKTILFTTKLSSISTIEEERIYLMNFEQFVPYLNQVGIT